MVPPWKIHLMTVIIEKFIFFVHMEMKAESEALPSFLAREGADKSNNPYNHQPKSS